DFRIARRTRSIDVGVAEKIGHVPQKRIIRGGWLHDAASRFLLVRAMMSNPGLTKHLFAETSGPALRVEGVFGVRALRMIGIIESMRARAQRDDRFAGQI